MPTKSRSREAQAWQHLYSTARWRRKRERQITRQPFCECPHHKGKRVRADHPDLGGVAIADHVEQHRGDLKKFWYGKLQTMGKHCHDRFKRSEEAGGHGFLVGADEHGLPLDASHPFNQ